MTYERSLTSTATTARSALSALEDYLSQFSALVIDQDNDFVPQ